MTTWIDYSDVAVLGMPYRDLKRAHVVASSRSVIRDTYAYGSDDRLYESSCFHSKARLWNDAFLWQTLLATEQLVRDDSRVLELLPGTSHKVAIALKSLNFSGVCHQIDLLEDPYAPKDLPFDCERLDIDAFGSDVSWCGYDLIVGNHVLDDLLVGHLIDKSTIVRAYYRRDDEQRLFWERLDRRTVSYAARLVSARFIEKIATMDSGSWLVLRHYPSTIEMSYDQVRRVNFTTYAYSLVTRILSTQAGTQAIYFDLDAYAVPKFTKLKGSVFGLKRM